MEKKEIIMLVLGVLVALVCVVFGYILCRLYVLARWARSQEALLYMESLQMPAPNAFGTLKHAILRRLITSSNSLQEQHDQQQNEHVAAQSQEKTCCICLEPYVDEEGNPVIPEAPTPLNHVMHSDVMDPDVMGPDVMHPDAMHPYSMTPDGDVVIPDDVTQDPAFPNDAVEWQPISGDHDVTQSSHVTHDVEQGSPVNHDVTQGSPVNHDVTHTDVTSNNFQILRSISSESQTHHDDSGVFIPTAENCNVDKNGALVLGILKCGHAYHFECIWRWMQSRTLCPVCRSYTNMNQDEIRAASLFVVFPDLDPSNKGLENTADPGAWNPEQTGSTPGGAESTDGSTGQDNVTVVISS